MSRLRTFAAFGIACAICACSGGADTQTPVSEAGVTGMGFLYETGEDGFARVTGPKIFDFPADHGPHPGFRSEWWYTTGNLEDEAGREFGFELTFFRLGVSAPLAIGEPGIGVWMANFAITDVEAGRFVAFERLARGDPVLAFASGTPFAVRVEDWTLSGIDSGSARLQAAEGGWAIDLTIDGLERLVYQGDRGFDRKGPEAGNASYYYSAPRLDVTGNVRIPHGESAAVSGTAWLDHEWSSSSLSADVGGWDWFSLQLEDGRNVMYYRLRERTGATSPFSGGSVQEPGGRVRRIAAEDVAVDPLRYWTSPATGVRYPVSWRFQLPSEGLDLEVRAALADQEVALSVRYWEGSVRAFGAGGTADPVGRGYLELTGYD